MAGRRQLALIAVAVGAALAVAVPVLSAARGGGLVTLHSTRTIAFAGPDGSPVTMNGLNVIPVWTGSPGRTWSQDHYSAIAAKGFTAVRFVLYWDAFEPRRGAFDATSIATLDTAIARAKAAGLYVILDMIHLWGPMGMRDVPTWAHSGDSVATVAANAGPYVRKLAARYATEVAVAAYDPVNEPRRWPIDQDAVLRAYDRLIATIRPVAPQKIVLVEPEYGDSSLQGSCAHLGTLTHRENVVLSIHLYFAGGDDDGFGADCRQAGAYAYDATTGYDPPQPLALRSHLQSYLEAVAPFGLPLFVGEFGMAEQAPGRDRWVHDLLALLDAHGIGRMWWEYWTSANRGALSATYPDGRWRSVADLLVSSPTRTGAATRTPTRPPASTPGPPSSDPRIMAVGDFTGCQGAHTCSTSAAGKVKAQIAAADPNLILGIGDFQYQSIDTIDTGFDLLYGPKPGGLWGKIRPTAGPTHDVRSCTDPAYRNYWGRDPMRGYSFGLGAWHIISLPAAAYRFGCATASVLAWLQADLAANRSRCTLAFWQDPYWTRPTVPHRREPKVKPWIQALYDHGADVVLQASNHDYQRFAPQNPSDGLDPARGLRAFVVGTGGIGHYTFTGTAPNVDASDAAAYGALAMTLHPGGYDWRFSAAAGGSFSDAGSGRCH